MTTCGTCGRELAEGPGAACSACFARASELARVENDALSHAVADALAQSLTDSMLAQSNPMAELTRDVEVACLALGELDTALLSQAGANALTDLETLLSRMDSGAGIEGLALADLLDRRGPEMTPVRKGLTLMNARRYAEAAEWWSLHRQQTDGSQGRLQVLYLLLETVTYNLAGDRESAARTRGELKLHQWYASRRAIAR